MTGDATIRLQPVGGQWETLGADRLRGLVAENIEAVSDSWGPSALSFEIKAEPGAMRPDLLPFTPIELEVDGMVCWAGRVKERPAGERVHNVQCEGWQFHLDDDVYDRNYVHTRMSDWSDARSNLSENLAQAIVAAQVSTNGGLLLGFPAGTAIANQARASALIDLGPDNVCKRITVTYTSSATANLRLAVRAFATFPTVDNAAELDNAPVAASATVGYAFPTARRWLRLDFQNDTGAPVTPAADAWVQFSTIRLYRDSAYEFANTTILKADMVVKDARGSATLLNQANDYITAGTFNIPEFVTAGYQTPRDVIEAANAYENYRLKIGGPDLKTLVFGPKPLSPLFEVGDWSGSEFSDGSISGQEIFNKVVVEATGPDGARLVSIRTQTGTLVDRNGSTRSKTLLIRNAVTPAAADRFGDLWLTEHKTAPFAGRLVIRGNGARRVQGGATVPPHEFLLHAGEKIRLGHRLDPDTGSWGRDGRIAAVTYNHNERRVTIDIDDRRDHFETVLQRYGVLVDQLNA